MSNKIRSITERKPDREMKYVVGVEYAVGYENKLQVRKVISHIEIENNICLVFVESDNEIQLWKEIPKNEYIQIENFID